MLKAVCKGKEGLKYLVNLEKKNIVLVYLLKLQLDLLLASSLFLVLVTQIGTYLSIVNLTVILFYYRNKKTIR